jgi:ankyrin repeat protein
VEAPPGDREALILETVKTAAELGVDVNAVNNDGKTALDLAKQRKYESVVAYLQENGAR